MKKLLLASALILASASANAVVVTLQLNSHLIGRAANSPSSSGINPAPTFVGDYAQVPLPTWTYDTVTGVVSSVGTSDFRSNTNPFIEGGRVFDRFITNLTIDGNTGSTAGTTSYECRNSPSSGQAAGGFGGGVGANICGNYTLGGNFTDNSTLSYSGVTVNRVMGGDDAISGPAQSIDDYQLLLANFGGAVVGANLTFQSANWLSQPQSPANSAGTQMNWTVTSVVPVPAAVWLFGSAVGLLGIARRRTVKA